MEDFSRLETGMFLEIIADTNEYDPHDLEIGTIVSVEFVLPPFKKESLPYSILEIFDAMGYEPKDIPSRVHVVDEYGYYYNLSQGDFIILDDEDDEEIKAGDIIEMLDDDMADGYSRGDKFEVIKLGEADFFGESFGFRDNDNDIRFLKENNPYKVVSE